MFHPPKGCGSDSVDCGTDIDCGKDTVDCGIDIDCGSVWPQYCCGVVICIVPPGRYRGPPNWPDAPSWFVAPSPGRTPSRDPNIIRICQCGSAGGSMVANNRDSLWLLPGAT
ncbi:hypothetical protein GNI_017350 [Gregarina niphandrodes]|uniref:Uncharacterized protein n=1 Tax=Gregarina niphandrodes TaxID=110365 RepID=A0A023BC39_GRENI|nr:hypothetical protein GNI_017350 [Gregarina niphandrodes]EZG82128.1 hypothetical protein GNI_017350 [Gregarina niphandrodes]|eukprot:XP_011129034.1 hypothetical protein GNI_017350 [Gregarina niphandrodes]